MSSRDIPKHEPTVSDHIPRSHVPVSREDIHSADDRVGIQYHAQDTPSHLRHSEPLDNSETKVAVQDRASRKTINHQTDPTDYIPRSLRASSHRSGVGMHDAQNGPYKDHRLDTSTKPPPRSYRGIENDYASHRRTQPESDPVDTLTSDFTSIKLEDRAIRSRHQHLSTRPRQSPYGRNHERRRIVEESKSHRLWKPMPEPCRPGLELSQEIFNKAKETIMYIVISRSFPVECWATVGLSRETIFYAFTELGLRLPPNMNFDGLLPYAKANEDGFDNIACKLKVWDEFRAEQLVRMECDEDTSEFISLVFISL